MYFQDGLGPEMVIGPLDATGLPETLPLSSSRMSRTLTTVNVTKETDGDRGVRLFDNLKLSVRDVASEDLFVERLRVVNAVFENYVLASIDDTLDQLAKALVVAVKMCVSRYFSTQSLDRVNRPLITRTVYLQSDVLFCTTSEYVKAMIYTKTDENDAVDTTYLEAMAVNEPGGGDTSAGGGDDDDAADDEQQRFWTERMKEYMRENTAGGKYLRHLYSLDRNDDSVYTGPRSTVIDDHRQRHPDGRPDVVLFVVADVEAIANFLSYMYFMTPVDLTTRYEVSVGCGRRGGGNYPAGRGVSTAAARVCCDERLARKRKVDVVRRAIDKHVKRQKDEWQNKHLETEREDPKDDGVSHAHRLVYRNRMLTFNFLLLMVDKVLSSILDNGFETANKRRRYGVNSKQIGGASIFTGIIDTVGTIAVEYRDGVLPALGVGARKQNATTPKKPVKPKSQPPGVAKQQEKTTVPAAAAADE